MQNLRQRIISFYKSNKHNTTPPSAEQFGVDADVYAQYVNIVKQCACAAQQRNVASYQALLQQIAGCRYALHICTQTQGELRLCSNIAMECLTCDNAQRYVDLALCGKTKEQIFLLTQYDIDMQYHNNARPYLMMNASSAPVSMTVDEIEKLLHEMAHDGTQHAMPSAVAAVRHIYTYQLSITEARVARLYRDAREQAQPASTSVNAVSGGLCTPK